MLSKTKKQIQFLNFKTAKCSVVRTNKKIIQEELDKCWLRFVEKVFLEIVFSGKIASAPNDIKATLNATRQRYPIYVELLLTTPKFHPVLLYDRLFSR